jgi:3-oxoacyl-[acyl-carrier protein] reductase
VAEGANVLIVGRGEASLTQAAAALAGISQGAVTTAVADITTSEGRERVLSRCSEPDILINNAAGPAPGDFRDWRQQDWFDAVNANMYSAIDMMRQTLDGMVARGFGRIINITSFSVKQPLPELGLSNSARAGLTAFVAGVARQVARDNVTINNLLPGFFDTERGRAVLGRRAESIGLSVAEYCDQNLCAGRMGTIDEFGSYCAFLCSPLAGYITGQNLLLDGGDYRGIF